MNGDKAASLVSKQGGAISAAVTEYVVRRWLEGSTLKSDRPTLAQLRAAGYDVVRSTPDNTDSEVSL